MKMMLTVLAAFFAHTLAGEEALDPFAPKIEEAAKRPQRLPLPEENLKRFSEPSLKRPSAVDTADIRFIWVPTFKRPVSIRATKAAGKVILKVVRMSGKGGYEWGKIEVEKSLALTDPQWTELIDLVSVDGAREPSQKAIKEVRENFADVMSGLDGSIWYLEVRDRKGYTVEGVPNPIVGDQQEMKRIKETMKLDFGPFMAVCLKLFEFSGLDERPDY